MMKASATLGATLALVVGVATSGAPTTEDNMNGEYLLASTPNQKGKGNWSTNFKVRGRSFAFCRMLCRPSLSCGGLRRD